MRHHAFIAAGFGGQGVMLFGKILSLAAMYENLYTTWLPSYGPEMRGGTANCTVVISEKYIASPVVDKPSEVIAFNIPSMYKFEKFLPEGGLLLLNTSVIDREPERKDVKVIKIPANEIADELGNIKVQNMVMLGAYLKATDAVSFDSVKAALEKSLKGKKADLLELNLKAIEAGMKAAEEQL
ncbi:2-oxoacid:acceptor oxidoreductase, gamma subunit, pyruvate/2-ketoisovalerate family [Marinitoga piezophila KA3]|uniref:2-oxoacid:acceptor oxidoreductase, gamma subunit, pyruvate/2-ketoisovalerate family n=1 Tax=Marinitoga piezophila (strain DSM 14283 / JCM 11233 / KA3) TaxID=443254 RepID=H2J396_MARPK|nr:2-oxoacid:acceptor oxidoreductase family protein [Marinitoga piezophila]AEX84614.1 2-oxoacid:acceptor oxidoreductase, gamma subunit, pyruvate/2-ketoisovalerate family [Marinitoga piezophila KA3]